MYIAFINTALLERAAVNHSPKAKANTHLRRQAYDQVCHKYRNEIEAIRQYQPNWKPRY